MNAISQIPLHPKSLLPALSVFVTVGIGIWALQSRRSKPLGTRRFSRVDERLRQALKDEDQKSTPFPKEVDMEPTYD